MRMSKEWYKEINNKLIENVRFDFGCHNWEVQKQIKNIIFPELLEKKNVKVEAIEKLLTRIPCLNRENKENISNIADRIFSAIEY